MESTFHLLHIKDSHHSTVPGLQKLYEEAFPAKERRSFAQLLHLLQQPDMYLFALTTANEVAGLCIYWQLEGFLFLEHLAIAPAHQSTGQGTQLMQWLLRKTSSQLVLEVERPTDSISRRRIQFYQERLGFTFHNSFDYHQPPYQKEGEPVPLYLMSSEPVTDTARLMYIANLIKQQVYERFYE